MSIPRLAIHRPVTMFMLSAIITLLGFISLTRLPVDLMPEFQQPTLNIRTSYAGVGPLEMEELITRPIEQAVGAVPGLIRIEVRSPFEVQLHLAVAFGRGRLDADQTGDRAHRLLDRPRDQLLHFERTDAGVAGADVQRRLLELRHQVDRQTRQRDEAEQRDDRAQHEHRDGAVNREAGDAHKSLVIDGLTNLRIDEFCESTN